MALPPEFNNHQNVPVLGQPRIGNWFFTLQVFCPCNAALLLVGQLGATSVCPQCGKVYSLSGMPTMENNMISVPLAMLLGRGAPGS
jgi:hypothetical protein